MATTDDREPARAASPTSRSRSSAREFDAIHDEVFAELGDRDRALHREHDRDAAAARACSAASLLLASRCKPAWVAGTAALSLAKILENMEIGHNVMHGQWDWMNDPQIHSSHLGLGHRVDRRGVEALPQLRPPHLHQHPRQGQATSATRSCGSTRTRSGTRSTSLQPFYNLRAGGALRVGRRRSTTSTSRRSARARSPRSRCKRELKGIARQGAHARSSRTTSRGRCSARSRRAVASARRRLEAARRARERAATRAQARAARRPRRRASDARAPAPSRSSHADGQRHRQRRPQRVGLRDHLLRPLPRPDVHVQPGGGRGRDARRLVRAPAARRGQHRGQPALPRRSAATSATRSSTTCSPTCRARRYARDRAAGARRSASATSCPTTPGPFCQQLGMVQRTILRLAFPAGRRARSRARTAASRLLCDIDHLDNYYGSRNSCACATIVDMQASDIAAIAEEAAASEVSPEAQETAARLSALMRHLFLYDRGNQLRVIEESRALDDPVQGAAGAGRARRRPRSRGRSSDLAERFGVSVPSMSRAVDALVKKKLATRVEDPSDRRVAPRRDHRQGQAAGRHPASSSARPGSRPSPRASARPSAASSTPRSTR